MPFWYAVDEKLVSAVGMARWVLLLYCLSDSDRYVFAWCHKSGSRVWRAHTVDRDDVLRPGSR